MKELQEIVRAFENADKRGLKTALATVVQVFGSAYRHEGARMLISENGEFTGAISGGCLEGDALRKARLAMIENRNMLVTYDTTDEDDATLGVGLGCNGIIQVLLEPIDSANPFNPVNLFKSFLSKRQHAVLGTFFSLEDKLLQQPGTCMLVTGSGTVKGDFPDKEMKENFIDDAHIVTESTRSIIKDYAGTMKGFVEYLKPPVHLMIFGAGNDAIPLVEFASILGWEISVIDGRSNYVTTQRFPLAKQVIIARPENALADLQIDTQTVAVLMTHNYNYDIAVLRQALNLDIDYIGALGPKKKLQRMLDELTGEGRIITEKQLAKIFGPTGLDIGSETPEEIALSIIAEIKAVLSKTQGSSLKFKETEQHTTTTLIRHSKSKFTACSINL